MTYSMPNDQTGCFRASQFVTLEMNEDGLAQATTIIMSKRYPFQSQKDTMSASHHSHHVFSLKFYSIKYLWVITLWLQHN